MKGIVRKSTGGIWQAIGLGVGAAAGGGLLLAAAGAYLVDMGPVPETAMGYLSSGILILATALGSAVALTRCRQKTLPACLGAGGSFLLVLALLGALAFDGSFHGAPVTAALVLGTSTATGLFSMRKQGRRRTPRRFRIK